MADLNSIYEAIKQTINSVQSVGAITYGQQTGDRSWRTPLTQDNAIRGWIVTPVASATSAPAMGRTMQQITWRIHHLAQIDDDASASRRAFDNRLQAVRAAFLADDRLSGVVVQSAAEGSIQRGLQINSADEVMFNRVALHLAECTLVTLSIDGG